MRKRAISYAAVESLGGFRKSSTGFVVPFVSVYIKFGAV